ncbi:hypothetical protein MLD38_007621 [Melastoma candidum]|uniref:Uncharacterized protein n=1 Tax=Melastoma candidum TaxID=119954 RepID=A0ACB9RS94_9MYRT|nr:hypothetical protein MLD38_007621 [Melastoma candidum]
MLPPESPSLYELLAGAGLINYDMIDPPQPHPQQNHQQQQQSFCSSSYYIPMMDVSNERDAGSDGIPEDRTTAALRNHKEAEKRRRARINSHLDKLRSLLPCNSKTDKATLLAMVVQRVRELKQQTSDITALGTFPSESDEISVLSCEDDYSEVDILGGCAGGSGLVFKASFCCEDRSDLLPELIEVLNSLHLKVQKAEMSTLGGRMRNVLVVAASKDQSVESIQFLQNSLKSLLERPGSAERSKRRRILDRKIIV